jgi:hypothetical protein
MTLAISPPLASSATPRARGYFSPPYQNDPCPWNFVKNWQRFTERQMNNPFIRFNNDLRLPPIQKMFQ